MGRKRDDGSIELFYRLRNENKSADANFAHNKTVENLSWGSHVQYTYMKLYT